MLMQVMAVFRKLLNAYDQTAMAFAALYHNDWAANLAALAMRLVRHAGQRRQYS